MSAEEVAAADPSAEDYPYPDESSDCTFPEEIDLQNKKELLKWKFYAGTAGFKHWLAGVKHLINHTNVRWT